MVQIRVGDDGLILQQLLYADEVRSMADLHIESVNVSKAELSLAQQLIEQGSVEGYDPAEYTDEEKQRILAAQIDKKIAGQAITVAPETEGAATGAEVIDLMDALRKSVGAPKGAVGAKSSVKETKAPARRGAKRADPGLAAPAKKTRKQA